VKTFATRDEQEVAGYSEVMEMIFSHWDDIDLTENHIKQLHRDLLKYSGKDDRHRGKYKTLPNHVEAFGNQGPRYRTREKGTSDTTRSRTWYLVHSFVIRYWG